jgi:polyhydroxybutyrate depolymerase
MHHPRLLLLALPALFPLAACGSGLGVTSGSGGAASSGSGGASWSVVAAGSTSTSAGVGGSDSDADGGPIGGDRPVVIHVPVSYQPGTAVPLVMMLHGYSATAALEEDYLDIIAQSDAHGFIYAMPNGTVDKSGLQFWNADNACCDIYSIPVDDSAYLSDVITEIEGRYTIDPKQVFVMGHSNGAFMAYRLACDHADQIAAIVSLAGAMPTDATVCKPSAPVSTLEIHGTADTVILFTGGGIEQIVPPALVAYPAVTTTVADWVSIDGCSTTPDTSSPNITLDALLPPDQTTVTKYATGCKTGAHAELWTIVGGAHVPTLSPAFTPDFIQWLYDHPRP